MRPLWKIEKAVLDITAGQYVRSLEALRFQIASAQVGSFKNSGAGFFSTLCVDPSSPPLIESSPLSGAYGDVLGIEHGMGFIVFLEDGRLSMIEGYCNANVATTGFDFERAFFDLVPWESRFA